MSFNDTTKQSERQQKGFILFRNSQFLMPLQFCSSTLLLTSTVQLLRAEEKRKGEKEHLTEREPKKGIGSYTKCIPSQNFSPPVCCVRIYSQSNIPHNKNTHTRDQPEKFSHAYRFKHSHTQTKKNHTFIKDYKNLSPQNIENHINSVPNHNHLCWVPFSIYTLFISIF